ncbi:MAG: hypothetical protein QF812_03165 [Nitrososphaerales archaeon]|nr:hypothetical protein [Nitrososphaerales archaeon]HJN57456.1 hypothetical protein [Nitrososphaerales archaeon]
MNRDWAILKKLLIESNIVTLICDNQLSKVQFLSNILMFRRSQNRISIYLDIDTNFTIFLEDNHDSPNINNLFIFRVKEKNLNDVVADISSIGSSSVDTIVFDSVSMFYSFKNDNITSSNQNRRLGVYLSLLQVVMARSNGVIILTSMTRARKRQDDDSWYFSYAGGRLLRKRSDLILELKSNEQQFEVSVLKSPDEARLGIKLNLNRKNVET